MRPTTGTGHGRARWRQAGAAALVILLGGAGTPVAAEPSLFGPVYFPKPPRVVQRPTHLIRRSAPIRGYARSVPAADPAAPDAPSVPGPAVPDAPAPLVGVNAPLEPPAPPSAPVVKPQTAPFVVAALGDSIGQILAQGLSDTYAGRTDITILRKARENTGLVRDDYFDWVRSARDLIDSQHVDLAVMSIGSNDRQQLRDGQGTYDPLTPRWNELYAARVTAIAALFRGKNIPLVWVGMPVMKSDRLSSDMLALNEVVRDAVKKAGASYVDVWEAFTDDRGQFALYGPDVDGQTTKLRAGDGVHFTRAGGVKLAHFVEADIKRAMDDAAPPPDAALASLPPAASAIAVAPVALPVPPANDLQTAIPAPAALQPVVIPIRPAAGPVLSLTTPAISPNGELAARATGVRATVMDSALAIGHGSDRRPGRADDFSWPRRP